MSRLATIEGGRVVSASRWPHLQAYGWPDLDEQTHLDGFRVALTDGLVAVLPEAVLESQHTELVEVDDDAVALVMPLGLGLGHAKLRRLLAAEGLPGPCEVWMEQGCLRVGTPNRLVALWRVG